MPHARLQVAAPQLMTVQELEGNLHELEAVRWACISLMLPPLPTSYNPGCACDSCGGSQ